MVLQAFEGLSDHEATDLLEVDLQWQAAAGVDAGAEAFHPTVLVGQRNRLRASARPRRLFEDTKVVARQADGERIEAKRAASALLCHRLMGCRYPRRLPVDNLTNLRV